MAYNPNTGYIKSANQSSANGQADQWTELGTYTGGRGDISRHFDEGTFGGSAAKYDPVTGRMIEDSSANQEADYYRQQALAAQARQGVQLDNTQQNADRSAFQKQMSYSDQERARQGNAYNQQQASTNMYRDLAEGRGPSLAQAQMQQGMNNIRSAQTSAAASARGPAGLAMAQQQAAGNMAAQGQQLNANLGQVRAQEQLGAMQGYAQGTQALSGAASQMRGQDQSGAQLWNQSRGISAQNAHAQGQLDQQARDANDKYALANELSRQNVYQQNMQGGFQRRAADLASARFAEDQETTDDNRFDKYAGAAISTAGSILGSVYGLSDERAKENITPIGGGAGRGIGAALSTFGSTIAQAAPMSRQDPYSGAAPVRGPAPLTQSGANLQGVVDLRGVDPDSEGAQMYAFNPKGKQVEPTGPLVTNFEGPIGSDERSKQKIADLSDALQRSQMAMYGSPPALGRDGMMARANAMEASQAAMYGAPTPMQSALQNLTPYAYNYKPGVGEDAGKRHVGIMAQDLERSPAGSTIVESTPRGKAIDLKGATSFNLAAAADLQKQIDELKARRGGV